MRISGNVSNLFLERLTDVSLRREEIVSGRVERLLPLRSRPVQGVCVCVHVWGGGGGGGGGGGVGGGVWWFTEFIVSEQRRYDTRLSARGCYSLSGGKKF